MISLPRLRNRRALGNRGETIATQYLARCGCQILHRNYYTPRGEIDIVFREDGCLVFAEVKQRSVSNAQAAYGRPALAVNFTKRSHIISSALCYLQKEKTSGDIRFDVIEILTYPVCEGFVQAKIDHIRGAFGVNDSR